MDFQTGYLIVVGIVAVYGAVLSTVSFLRATRRGKLRESRHVAVLEDMRSGLNKVRLPLWNILHGYHGDLSADQKRALIGHELGVFRTDYWVEGRGDLQSWRIRRSIERLLRLKSTRILEGVAEPLDDGTLTKNAAAFLRQLDKTLALIRGHVPDP